MAEQVLTEQAPDAAAVVDGTVLAPNVDSTLLAANATRDRLIVSANVADVWLGYGKAAVVGKGHCVRTGDSPFVEFAWRGSVHAISTGAAVVGYTETSYGVGDDQGERPTGADAFVPQGPPGEATPTASLPVVGGG